MSNLIISYQLRFIYKGNKVSTRNNLYSSNYKMGPSSSKTTPPPKPEQEELLKKPWRTHKTLENDDWTEKVSKDLLDDISKKLVDKNINVAFIGPVASGKSSLINSYFTTVLNRITSRTPAGNDISSFTLRLRQIKAVKQLANITFYDTMGIEESDHKGFRTKHTKAIATGQIKPGTKLDEDIADKVENRELFQHCIVFVLDGENIMNGFKADLEDKIGQIKHQLKDIQSGPNRVVIVTHIDSLCPAVNDDITNVFKSKAVEQVIKKASVITGVTVGQIFPVKNYVAEQDANIHLNILLLLALQRIVDFSIDAIDSSNSDNYSANDS